MDLSISQNFITDTDLVKKLIDKAKITGEDTVYDIGAGTGIITSQLAGVAKKVYAFELDRNFKPVLINIAKDHPNVEVLMSSFLDHPLPEDSKYKVFSNIPFSITSDIFNKLIFAKNPPTDSFIFMQKEAAYRYMGEGEGYLISLLIKPFFDVKIIHRFSQSDFSPKPSVDIVLLQMKKLEHPVVDIKKAESYRNFIIYTLWQQKPTLKLRLNKVFTSDQFHRQAKLINFSVDTKARDLTLDQWIGLFNYYSVGVYEEKKKLVDISGRAYMHEKMKLSGPGRTKIRL